jgi:hypothetical protein
MKLSALIPTLALVAGCAGGYVQVPDVYVTGAVVATPAPVVDLDYYPRYWYHGYWVYDVHGRLYRHDGARWFEYRERPHDFDHARRYEAPRRYDERRYDQRRYDQRRYDERRYEHGTPPPRNEHDHRR